MRLLKHTFVLILTLIGFALNGQSEEVFSYELKKGEVLDILLLDQRPDTKEELGNYFEVAFPVARRMSYTPLPGFALGELTQMLYPQVLQYSRLVEKAKYVQSKFSATDLDKLKIELDQIMEDSKPFLNQKLLKAELAVLLGISNPELARLLNERIGMNFFEYVNYYRIQEFIRLSKTEEAKQYTFFALAQEAGFNSKATFNKSFKKIMGCSPTAYLK